MSDKSANLPRTPPHRIRSVAVVGGFLDGVRLEFADGLNCIIGGRGTGKTTILELIRFAFDALPSEDTDRDQRKRVDALLEQNLAGGRVQIAIETGTGLSYVVSRTWDEAPVVLTAEGKPTELTLRSGSVFSCDIYSQHEIERIAERSASQLVLVDRFKKPAIAEIESQLQELERRLKTSADAQMTIQSQIEEVTEELATLPEVEERLKQFTQSSGENSGVVDQAHAVKSQRDQEHYACDSIEEELNRLQERLLENYGWLSEQLGWHLTDEAISGPNSSILRDIKSGLVACGEAVDDLLRQAAARVTEAHNEFERQKKRLDASHQQQDLEFRSIIEKHEAAMEQASERAQLERTRTALLAKKRLRVDLEVKVDEIRRRRGSLMEQLSELRDQRFSIRQSVVDTINSHVAPTIQVRLAQQGDTDLYSGFIANAIRNAGVRHVQVASKLASTLPPRELAELVRRRDSHSVAIQSGINADQAAKVVEALNQDTILFDLEIVDLNDRPTIRLLDGEAYKDSLTISTGQKCTSILPILLLDSDRPLLVDQPEDNLDNGFIYETVVKRLRDIQRTRQLIFVTHNPNIPVLGDARRVFVLKSSGSKARVECQGTVDECRTPIVDLLEGGEEAFRLRQQRYES